MPKIGVRYMKASWGLFCALNGLLGYLVYLHVSPLSLSIHFGNDQVFFHSCYKGRFMKILRVAFFALHISCDIGLKFQEHRAESEGCENSSLTFQNSLNFGWFWAATFLLYASDIFFWFVKRALLHVSTCSPCFALAFRLQVRRLWKTAAGFYDIFDSLSFIAAMDAGLFSYRTACLFGASQHGSVP